MPPQRICEGDTDLMILRPMNKIFLLISKLGSDYKYKIYSIVSILDLTPIFCFLLFEGREGGGVRKEINPS